MKKLRLFKYLPKQYLDQFFRTGSLKIGTLYEYQKVEEYGNVIGDKNEGVHETVVNVAGGGLIDMGGNSEAAKMLKTVFKVPDNSKIKFAFEPGTNLIICGKSENLYLYCVTHEFNPDVMKAFQCNACMEIENPEGFFRAISRRIRHQAEFCDLIEIAYTDKRTHYTQPHKLHPAEMKDLEYAYQKELRAIWAPKKACTAPLYINVPEARRYCRPYLGHA